MIRPQRRPALLLCIFLAPVCAVVWFATLHLLGDHGWIPRSLSGGVVVAVVTASSVVTGSYLSSRSSSDDLARRRRLTRQRIERTFDAVDRCHELEDLRRSLAMLPPGSAGLSREEAMALTAELQESITRLRRLRDRLGAVLSQDD